MEKFTKKPVVIEAIQFTEKTKDQCLDFIKCIRSADIDLDGLPIIRITIMGGEVYVSLGDWIVKDEKGDFLPCKPDLFKGTYKAVA